MKLVFDTRWSGDHGIGRFSREISSRLQHFPLALERNPAAAFDPFILSFVFLFSQDNSIFLSPGYNGPIFCRRPYVVTVHDLNHIDRPENSSFLKRLYYRFILRRICLNAAAILTVSNFSRQRIVEWSGVNVDKVFSVGNGVSANFSPFGKSLGYEFPYVLCVSNRKGHKNEVGALKGFLAANLPVDTKLVFTGSAGGPISEAIESMGVSDRVHFSGRLSDDDLASLYRNAMFVLFPSFYEGFGLPIIEAFASGTPVITSNVTSMPEIAGDAALLVDPNSVDEIAAAVEKMYYSKALRDQLIIKGRERLSYYSWDAVAERVAGVLVTINQHA